MGARAMEDLKDMICRELDEIAEKGEMSAGELDTVYKLVVTKEKLLRIEELEEGLGYSQAGDWHAAGTYARGNSYRNGNSYDDGYMSHNSYGRRGGRGRYSRNGYSMSDGKMMIVEEIEGMMNDPELSQADRTALEKAMRALQK